MKNIAVFAQSLTVDYALEIIRGITSFFDKKDDVCMILTQTRCPALEEGIYEYQYWAGAEILKTRQIDAIIVISGSYAYYLSTDELKEIFKPFAHKPIVSISLDLGYENSVYTSVSCDEAYCDLIKHLKEVHGCKKIGFMSANLTTSSEAKERFEAYKNALAKNGFEYNPDYVLDGRFTTSSARIAIKNRFSSKDQVEFDAIVAANDLMALGCSLEFSELGLKIPDELKIIGFDDTFHAKLASPTLSTVAQQIFNQGVEAASLVYKMLNGESVQKQNAVNLFLKFRQTCGCIEIGTRLEQFKDKNGNLCPEEADEYIQKYQRHFDEIHTIYTLFDTIHTAGDLNYLYSILRYLIDQMDMNNMYIYMYDEPFSCVRGESIRLPEKARLLMYYDAQRNSGEFEPSSTVILNERILDESAVSKEHKKYLLSPLFSGPLHYGYVVGNVKKDDFEVYNIYLKILSNIIINSYEFTKNFNKNQALEDEKKKLLLSNTELDIQAKTDELTGILNRRGFLEMGQECINMSVRMNRSGIIFFADMDGLKQINDTYGHDMGDKAIKIQAEILQKALRSSDILGRLSGDEFAFVADGMQPEVICNLKKKIDSLCKTISESYSLPFVISISIGAAFYSKEKTNLMDLLIEADKNLYTEKKQKKCRSNQTEDKTSRL